MSHNNTKVSAIQNEKQNYRYFFYLFSISFLQLHHVMSFLSGVDLNGKRAVPKFELNLQICAARARSTSHQFEMARLDFISLNMEQLLLKTLIAFLNAFSWSNFAPGFNQFNFNFLNSLHFIAIIFPIFVWLLKHFIIFLID